MAISSLPGDCSLRLDLAASFLTHPTARKRDWEVQKQFLLAKGFSEDEVEDAQRRAMKGSWPLKPLKAAVDGIPLALPAGSVEQQQAGSPQAPDEDSSGEESDSDSSSRSSSSSSSSTDSDDATVTDLGAQSMPKEQEVEQNQAKELTVADLAKEQRVEQPEAEDMSLVELILQRKPQQQRVEKPQAEELTLADLAKERRVEQRQAKELTLADLAKEQRVEKCQAKELTLADLAKERRVEQRQAEELTLADLAKEQRVENSQVLPGRPTTSARGQDRASSSSSSSTSSSSSRGSPGEVVEKPVQRVQPVKLVIAKGQKVAQGMPPAAAAAPSAEAAGFSYRSDAELWPPGGQARPMVPAERKELRRATQEVRASYMECQEDISDLKAKASAYRRACTGKSELEEAMSALEVEAERLRGQWQKVVARVTSAWKDQAPLRSPVVSGVRPQVVRGKRWYVACLDGLDGNKRALGPLRPSAKEAVEDLKLLRSRRQPITEPQEPTPTAEGGGVEEEVSTQPEVPGTRRFKRLRLSAPLETLT